MSRPGPALLALLAVAASACAWGEPDGPAVLAVAPALVPNHLDVELRIAVRGFEPDVGVDFDDPSGSAVDAALSATLLQGSRRVELVGVARTSETELRATLPAGAHLGSWDVEVRGPAGRSATLGAGLRVYAAEVVVTTSQDERDPGATPWESEGMGFSLREAVEWVNAQGTPTEIKLAAPLTITMTGSQTGLTLTAPGAAIVADPGVVLDFVNRANVCIKLNAPDQRLVGATLQGCDSTFVELSDLSGASHVAQVTFVGANHVPIGIACKSQSGGRIGPGNDLSGLWYALKVDGSGYEIFGNRIHDSGTGARLSGDAVRLWQNVFFAGFKGPGGQPGVGVQIGQGSGPIEILHNVFHANAGSGVEAVLPLASLTVRDNLFTANAVYGLDARAAGLTYDHNGYFGNGTAVSAGLATNPATDLLQDPLYADAAGGDFSLQPGSPAIDAGVDTGLDVNGDAPGLWSGLAPDLGAFESP